MMGEIAQQLAALRGVRDLGMKDDAIKPSLIVGDRGNWCAVARRHRAEAGRQGIDLVAMAHPHLLARLLGPQPLEQKAIVGHADEGAAEFLTVAQRHPAAQLGAHRLHAIADRQHRNAGAEHDVGRARRRRLCDRGRPAREDDAARVEGADLFLARGVGVDLAIDPVLAHPPRDQLGDLAAEIEDQDFVGHRARPNRLSSPPRRRGSRATGGNLAPLDSRFRGNDGLLIGIVPSV